MFQSVLSTYAGGFHPVEAVQDESTRGALKAGWQYDGFPLEKVAHKVGVRCSQNFAVDNALVLARWTAGDHSLVSPSVSGILVRERLESFLFCTVEGQEIASCSSDCFEYLAPHRFSISVEHHLSRPNFIRR